MLIIEYLFNLKSEFMQNKLCEVGYYETCVKKWLPILKVTSLLQIYTFIGKKVSEFI